MSHKVANANRFLVTCHPKERNAFKQAAAQQGRTLSQYALTAMREKFRREQHSPTQLQAIA